ncbi:hypothetical protein OGAPHI_003021 [Ogataea philodendri]|uniref:HSF-type DNA-binding domain-containing protein n=1 Tax=Ogataea philodendri TaxID=1378263 RepID=A0A9P8P8R3_9ASCO|nr:uncharacterized protein OGAPHI_003021 [Ogataea philodendri]KAH3667372.1 hypothetical protein OGAPHI_003021 [Ogataea philodendri]
MSQNSHGHHTPLPPFHAHPQQNAPSSADPSDHSAPSQKVSAFVSKLYSMLNDPQLGHLIWWSRTYQNDYSTFALLPGAEFANSLTRYFKHGNVASFVRQLHMYGFHKVCDNSPTPTPPTNPNLSDSDQTSKIQQPVWEFRHSSGRFRKGDESSLPYIKRRSSSGQKSLPPNATEYVSSQILPPQHQYEHFYPPVEYHQPHIYVPVQDVQQQQQTAYEYSGQSIPPSMQDVEHKPRNLSVNSHISDNTEVSFQSSSRNRYPSVFLDPLAPAPLPAPFAYQNAHHLQHFPHHDQQYPPLAAQHHIPLSQRRAGSFPNVSKPLPQQETRLPRSIPTEFVPPPQHPHSPVPQASVHLHHRFASPVSKPSPSQPLAPRINTPSSHQRIMQMRPSVFELHHNLNSISSASTVGSSSIFSRTSVGSSIAGPSSSLAFAMNSQSGQSTVGRNSSISDLLNAESHSQLKQLDPPKGDKRSYDSNSESDPDDELESKKKSRLSSHAEH